MTFKELLSKIGEKSKQRKELIRQADEEVRIGKIVEERQKSSNERELLKLMTEDRESLIKEELDLYRKKRDMDIKFNHNPLYAKNIMKSEWEIMKERNLFSGKSDTFSRQKSVHKNNPNLFKSNMRLIR